MNTRKQPSRFLAIVLSLCMLFTMSPVTVFAAEGETVISSDTEWEAQTISNDVRVESGVTLTINGTLIISGEVTISGGGTIVRGSGGAYFKIGSGASFTVDGVTVDGNSISSGNSMFDVDFGTLDLKNSTVQNCAKTTSQGGAVNMSGGTLTIENTTITNCSATGYGGAIYLTNGATATIKSGIFSGNKTRTSSYGGGFIYNKISTLTIEGGSFLNNSSAGRGGAIYNAGLDGTETHIRGGVFSGNTSSYSGHEGSGAVYYSSENTADTVLYISGNVQFGDGEEHGGQDGVYLDTSSSGTALRKTQISSALQYPIHIYVECSEDRVIAEGVEDYKLTAADMVQMQLHDVGSTGTQWYAWLNSADNEVYLSATKPIYVVYDANGATGSVTDNTIYSADNNTVNVQSADGLTYEGATFKGWNTAKDGTGTMYQPGNTFNISETTTLYAQWAYNVWVGDVQVASQNASDVLEDGTVSYNAETKTLTLTGANITATRISPGGGYAAIISYNDLNIVLAEGSENKITLTDSTILTGIVATSEDGLADEVKNITISGNGKLDIEISDQAFAAIGISGKTVTIDGGADVSVTLNSTRSSNSIGIMVNSSVAIKNSTVAASVSDEAGENIAIMTPGAVTIENADVTASGYAGIMGMGMDGVSVTGNSTVKATGVAYAIAAADNITWSDTLIAQGRADATSGTLSEVTTNNDVGYNTFVLSSNTETVAHYVEIVPISSLHRHNICGEADCTHDGHEAVIFTALDDGAGNLADGITTPGGYSSNVLNAGNYYLTEDITNVNLSIEITGTVNLCLNGHTISGSAANGIFRIGENGVLNVCDCAGNGKTTESGRHNPIFLHSGGTLNLYGGTIASSITAVVIDADPSDNTNSAGGTVNVYGGTVSSTGESSQAIKVNADMTNAAVNIYGGEVTSPNNGILAESGTIRITGGAITGDIDTDGAIELSDGTITGDVAVADDVTMTGGTINGRLTIDSGLSEKKSVKISGSANIETTSGDAIYSSGNIDLEISGGTISAQNGYAVFVTRDLSKIYLSGNPVISGGSADVRILPTSSASDAVLVLHAKGNTSNAYTGDGLSISSYGTYNEDYYVAQGVTNAEMATGFSLVGLSDYVLAYNAETDAIQIKERTYTVTLPKSEAFTITAESGNTSPVEKGGNFSFTVTISDGYYKAGDFSVQANNTKLTPNEKGVYTIYNITADQAVTVEGVMQALDAPNGYKLSGTEGDNGWYTSDVAVLPPSGYQISDTFNGTYVDKITLTQSVGEDYTVYFKRSADGALSKGISIGPIKIDKDDPTISAVGDTTTIAQSDKVSITVSVGPSGVAAVYVRKGDGSPWANITDTYQAGYTVTENGTYQFMATNNAGVNSEIASVTYANIDAKKPVVTIVATHGSESYTSGAWTNQEIRLTPQNETSNLGTTTYQYSVDGGEWQDYTSPIVISADTDADGTVYAFRAISESKVESDAVSITVKRDTAAPGGEIAIGTNKWNQFLNSITFGLFFKDTQAVTISATDSGSGIAKVEYFVSDASYETAEALETAVDGQWDTYSNPFSIEPNSKNIIYAKVTDNAGNVVYVSSKGVVLYSDAAQKTQSISFTKTGTADVTAEVTLNGNMIDKIYCGDTLLTSGTDYTVDGGTITLKASWLGRLSAGDYTLTIHYNPLGVAYVDNIGNDAPATTFIDLSVQKAAGSVEITNDISKVYDGNVVSDVAYKASSTGSVTVEYKVRGAEDSTYTTTKPSAVNKYTVRVTVAADNTYTVASDTADFDITYLSAPSDPFDLSGTEGTGGWYTSNVTILPPEGYTVSSTLNGEYSGTLTISESAENVTIHLKDKSGQMTDAVSVGEIKIDKDDPTITATGDTNSYLQNDTAKITVADSTSGVAKVEVKKDSGEFVDITTSSESGYSVTENGTYTFRVTDNAGRTKEAELRYNRIDAQKPVVTIVATHGGESYTSGAWTNQDITLTPKNETSNLGTTTYQYSVDGGEWQNYTSSIVISADTDADGTVYAFRAKSESKVESDTVSITVKRDTVKPEGDITIKENSIRQFLNAITFGLFFNEDVDVAITGMDGLSGVASIQYYRSAEILAEDDLASLTGWTDYVDVIHETAVDAEKFLYYVKVTDKAGNTTLFGSSKATFDLTKPVIDGIVNGSTYYTTQKVTVTDANLDSVTLNGAPAALENGALILPGDTEMTYTITAADKAGNSTTVTVTMKTIASLAEDIDGLTAENVTSTNKDTLTAVKTATGNVDTESATEEEKAALQDILDNCDALLEELADVAQEISDVTNGVDGYDADSVKSSDKEAVEEFVERIEALLEGGNLTEEEKQNLESVKNEAETLLDKISETVEAGDTENIQNVQDVTQNNVKPEDKEDLEAAKEDIEQALNDYADNYTEDEKEQFEETLQQIEAALEVIQRVEKSEEAISALPESVSPDDTEAREQIDAAKEQYDALSEYEKALVSDEAAEKLETLLQQLSDYRIIEGNGSTWTKGSSEGITLTANGAYGKFTGVEIDGVALNAENYTAESGSTVITLKPDYLNTLTAEEHAITVLYTDGEATGTFTIAEKPAEPTDTTNPTDEDSAPPQTGDDFHIIFWIILMLISGGAVLALSVKRRRKKA